jgi:hypothetical protein
MRSSFFAGAVLAAVFLVACTSPADASAVQKNKKDVDFYEGALLPSAEYRPSAGHRKPSHSVRRVVDVVLGAASAVCRLCAVSACEAWPRAEACCVGWRQFWE